MSNVARMHLPYQGMKPLDFTILPVVLEARRRQGCQGLRHDPVSDVESYKIPNKIKGCIITCRLPRCESFHINALSRPGIYTRCLAHTPAPAVKSFSLDVCGRMVPSVRTDLMEAFASGHLLSVERFYVSCD